MVKEISNESCFLVLVFESGRERKKDEVADGLFWELRTDTLVRLVTSVLALCQRRCRRERGCLLRSALQQGCGRGNCWPGHGDSEHTGQRGQHGGERPHWNERSMLLLN